MFTVASSIHSTFGQNDEDKFLQLSSLLSHLKAAMRIAAKQDNGGALYMNLIVELMC